jgi:membrane-associated HD superfamily phosphohydrolase
MNEKPHQNSFTPERRAELIRETEEKIMAHPIYQKALKEIETQDRKNIRKTLFRISIFLIFLLGLLCSFMLLEIGEDRALAMLLLTFISAIAIPLIFRLCMRPIKDNPDALTVCANNVIGILKWGFILLIAAFLLYNLLIVLIYIIIEHQVRSPFS